MATSRRRFVSGVLATGAAGSLMGVRARAGDLAFDRPPPPPPRDISRLVGTYGAPDNILTIYEDGGRVRADGRGLREAELTRQGPGRYHTPDGAALVFEPPSRGEVSSASLARDRLARRDFGAEVQAGIRAELRADPARVRAQALAALPPREPPPRRSADLVDLRTVDPAIRLDIRYATDNNFMGFPLYERAAAYLQRPAAEALGRALAALKPRGYGLLIHDAYRPWFVTKMFWEATPPDARVFVADPAQGSRHNRGCAVDLTLYELATGRPVEMTGRYDEMSLRSYADFVGGTSRQRWTRDLLRREMARQGFAVYPQEWWHFDYKDWADYGIGVETFTELARTSPA